MKNPYPEFINDEASGEVVTNQRWHDWADGFNTAIDDFRVLLKNLHKLDEAILEERACLPNE